MMIIRDYQSKAELFQILSHPVRLQILDELRKKPSCVCHLQIATRRPQAYVSQQLRVLRDAGLVIDEKYGQNVYYRLCNPSIVPLLDKVLGPVEPALIFSECTCPTCVTKT
ncbi:MAG: metalloregulator ArsR/SmtB family transcription factor [Brevefilum sp.]|nr:metalloregulator ArsR/SmtB family transcription factor [Brevefilum sp.]